MTRKDFLDGLRRSLSGSISPQFINENLRFYEEYIETECRKGRDITEVLDELGDPSLIARTIIDTAPQAAKRGAAFSDGESYAESVDFRETRDFQENADSADSKEFQDSKESTDRGNYQENGYYQEDGYSQDGGSAQRGTVEEPDRDTGNNPWGNENIHFKRISPWKIWAVLLIVLFIILAIVGLVIGLAVSAISYLGPVALVFILALFLIQRLNR
ncbi:MAG: hypothetical protein K5989_07960 [Lachnospiraceae bacterium]|nr:hypothetical protein [Lachnospiraceae bacterium]